MDRRRALALLGLCVALRSVSLVRPCLSDDEAIYAVVAREMLAGRALYKDIVDHKPPAIYVIYEVTQAIGGPVGGMVVLHVLLILVVWATSLLLARIVRRCDQCSERGPPLVALLWVVFTTTLVDADSLAANCELFMMLPLVAAVDEFLGARDRIVRVGLAGVLIGVAMLFKYQAGIQLPVFGITWMIAQRRTPLRGFVGCGALAVGAALPFAVAAGWLAAHGALHEAWFWFKFNFAYIDAGSTGSAMRRMVVRVGFVVLSSAALYALALASLVGTSLRTSLFRRFAIGWLLASAAAVLVGGRFFGHYFHQLTAPLAVVSGPLAIRMWERHRAAFVAALAVPAMTFLVLGALHDRVMRAAGEPDPDYASVVSWLDAHAAPDDMLCVWGNSPVLYFEANRALGCRFAFANYLTGASPATPSQIDPHVDSSSNIVPEAWDMLELDLATRRPRFIIDGSAGDVAYYGKYPPALFPRLARVLDCHYERAAVVSGMQIYQRVEAAGCR